MIEVRCLLPDDGAAAGHQHHFYWAQGTRSEAVAGHVCTRSEADKGKSRTGVEKGVGTAGLTLVAATGGVSTLPRRLLRAGLGPEPGVMPGAVDVTLGLRRLPMSK